jgi:uncharacterized protein YdeI (YjbR/CyaY-like superfamily)
MNQLYVSNRKDWRKWLKENHNTTDGIWLIYYKKHTGKARIPYDDAVEEALCFGWIDSTVKSLGNGKRRQYFCSRNPKSVWSGLNKKYILGQAIIVAPGTDKIYFEKTFN